MNKFSDLVISNFYNNRSEENRSISVSSNNLVVKEGIISIIIDKNSIKVKNI